MRSNTIHPCGFAALALICGTVTALADQSPDYGAYSVGKFLSYANRPPPNGDIINVPELTISFGTGAWFSIIMDTGSTGIVASADQIPNFTRLPSRPGQLTYSSSGRIMIGLWVQVPVTVSGGNGASVTTSPIPVLAVTSIACTKTARQCTPEDHPVGVDLMGIGFDREHDKQPDSTPETNPFLNVADPTGAPMRRGYVVTRTGVHVGLTRANTRGDFHFVSLVQNPTIRGEWQAAPACITVNAQAAASCGSVLVDTGITSMFLTVPPTAVEGATTSGADGRVELSPGTKLGFTFPGRDGGIEAGYSFIVGSSADPLAPTTVHLNTTRKPFVNTGVHFLNGFDVLYDADGGFFAYRKRQSEGGADP